MHEEAMWQRAVLLFQQQRHDLAIRELRHLLSQAPDHAPAHALLARALAQTGALDEALAAAKQAIAHEPDLDFAHGSLAVVLWHRGELEPAAAAILRAIELDADDVDHRAMLAQIRLGQRRWHDALVAADDGLMLDPQDTDCLNLRSLALTKLGRGREANDSVDASLAKDPDNPFTHQARGWALLGQGDAKSALHHFQEALRRDPTLDGSRQGLVEALKARNPVYRLVLGWFSYLERFSGPRQFLIVIGIYFAVRFLGQAARAGGHDTAAEVISLSWLGFVLLVSCAVPIFNLLLLLHPLGRHALERSARRHAMLLGACVVVLAGVCLHAWLGDAAWSDRSWLFWLLFLLPVAGLGLFHSGWSKWLLAAFCLGCVVFWAWWSFRLEGMLADAIAQAPAAVHKDRIEAEMGHLLAPLRAHAELLKTLLQAVVVSTWYVLLAPKGRPKRRTAAELE